MLVIFLALIVGPIVAGKHIPESVFKSGDIGGFNLLQPSGLDNDDTWGTTETGTGDPSYTGWGTRTRTTDTASTAETVPTDGADSAKIRLF